MQQNKQKKARQYLIDLQRWRSVAALVACSITLILTIISVNSAMVRYTRLEWEDIYLLNTLIPGYVSMPLVWIVVYVIAWGIRKIANLLGRFRLARMMALWREDLEPIEINIEIYGLGRYNGLHDEKSEMSIPYDILEALADKYKMDPAALMKVYTKGLLDAMNERVENL